MLSFLLKILHRRLGARNVLLQTDPDTKQVRAKLAGFGPLKGEQEAASGEKKRVWYSISISTLQWSVSLKIISTSKPMCRRLYCYRLYLNSLYQYQDLVPLNWMAPEQFDKPDGKPRHYSTKSDSWSYGITVWEIFSKGRWYVLRSLRIAPSNSATCTSRFNWFWSLTNN